MGALGPYTTLIIPFSQETGANAAENESKEISINNTH